MIFTPDGRAVLPRHRVFRKNEVFTEPERKITVESRGEPGSDSARFVLKRIHDDKWTEHPLPIDPVKGAWVEKTTFAGDWVGFTWGNFGYTMSGQRVEPSESVKLMFSTANTRGFAPGKTVLIGEPATIYDFPSASNPVWAASRWWVAWVRRAETDTERKDPLREWQTMLTSIDPVTGALEHRRLTGLSNWNTHVSMKTTGGWLCVAWHASVDGTYPGTAKIVTAFEKLPK